MRRLTKESVDHYTRHKFFGISCWSCIRGGRKHRFLVVIQSRLEELVRERAGAADVARLTNPVHIAIGTV